MPSDYWKGRKRKESEPCSRCLEWRYCDPCKDCGMVLCGVCREPEMHDCEPKVKGEPSRG